MRYSRSKSNTWVMITILIVVVLLYGQALYAHGVFLSKVLQQEKDHMGYARRMLIGFCFNRESCIAAVLRLVCRTSGYVAKLLRSRKGWLMLVTGCAGRRIFSASTLSPASKLWQI